MGFFDFGKKKKTNTTPEEQLRNYPQMLTAKLLFADKPVLDKELINNKLRTNHPKVYSPAGESAQLYFFPDVEVLFEEGSIAAQCTIFLPNAGDEKSEVPPEALQQNWHWTEADEALAACRFEFLVSDFMSRTLDYKIRLDLFMDFLSAVTRSVNPRVIHSIAAQKLIAPDDLIESWTSSDQRTLHGLVNVRLFNISNDSTGEILMDTVGMHLLGLPDFQIRFENLDESAVGHALWNYAYYVYEHGDIITDGSTIQGLTPQSKWRCERQIAVVAPERVVIHLHLS